MKQLSFFLLAMSYAIASQSQSWNINGNGNINPANHFLGTTNNQPLKFRINNQYGGEIDSVNNKTFLGYGAGKFTTAEGNTAIGFKALNTNTTGRYNTAIGFNALNTNTTGGYNTANGNEALRFNITGVNNTAIGNVALYSNTDGNYNTATGIRALYSNTTGSYNTGNGSWALNFNTTGSFNTASGFAALQWNTTGVHNTAHGNEALYWNKTGTYNAAVGNVALHSNTTGSYNTASGGTHALASNTTGSYNTAHGSWALRYNTTGFYNTATGYLALEDNSTGNYNAAGGAYALVNNTDGFGNTALGYAALQYNTTADNNTAVGHLAGWQYVTGSGNTLIGSGADVNDAGRSNSTALGYNAIVDASNKVRIGNTAVTSIGGQVGWTTYSDGRYKQNIEEDIPGISFINKLRPVSYTVDTRRLNENYYKIKSAGDDIPPSQKQTGFIAQEVERAANELGFAFSGIDKPQSENGLYGLRYAELVVPLVKAAQEQQQIINDLQKRIEELEKRLGSSSLTFDDPSNTLQVSPNPASDIVGIKLNSGNRTPVLIKVFDSKGALVKQQTILPGSQHSVDMNGLPNGTYLISAEWSGKMKKTTKVLKQ